MYRYRVHGLAVASDLPLSHVARDPGDEPADVRVRYGTYDAPDGSIRVGDWLCGTSRALRLRIPEVGTFVCVDSREIWVSPEPRATGVQVQATILGTALGIIHYQRAEFPLHGAFVCNGDRAFGFCGDSGEGKSTLGLALLRTGSFLLGDDVAVVRTLDGSPRVHADGTHLKLWEGAADHFAVPLGSAARVDQRHEKYFVPAPRRAYASPPLLAALVFLESGAQDSDPVVAPLDPLGALVALRQHTYRSFLISPMGLDKKHLAFSGALLDNVAMYRFRRPRRLDRLEEGLRLLMEEFARVAP